MSSRVKTTRWSAYENMLIESWLADKESSEKLRWEVTRCTNNSPTCWASLVYHAITMVYRRWGIWQTGSMKDMVYQRTYGGDCCGNCSCHGGGLVGARALALLTAGGGAGRDCCGCLCVKCSSLQGSQWSHDMQWAMSSWCIESAIQPYWHP